MEWKRITVDLEPAMFDRLRQAAFDRRESMSVIVREGLTAVLPPEGDGDNEHNPARTGPA